MRRKLVLPLSRDMVVARRRWSVWKFATYSVFAVATLASIASCSVLQWIPDTPDQPPEPPPVPEGVHLLRSDAGADGPVSDESKLLRVE